MEHEEHLRMGAWAKVPEAAAHFKIPRSRMYHLIQQGDVPAVRVGQRSIRVDLREVERAFAEKRRIYPDSALAEKIVAWRAL